ncbi:MAG: DNA polymerase IV, partial [Acidimicrobiales bacterium]
MTLSHEPGLDTADSLGIVHVDMDAFFAAVEVAANPALAGKPVIVGGTGGRGVVASATYEARAYGVSSAMPTGVARRLCPDGVFLAGRYQLYLDVSRRLHDTLQSFTPLVEGVGLDEAFLDVSGAHRLFGNSVAIARLIRRRVEEDLGLACSVGLARSKLVAKLASEAAKPIPTSGGPVPGAGVIVVPGQEELAFLHPMPVSRLWGVGPSTASRLKRLGVQTVGELARLPVESLVECLGKSAGRHLHELAWARDPRPVESDRQTKSVGHEETYPKDVFDRDDLCRQLVRLADGVASRLRSSGKIGRTITLKVRYGDFSTITRSRTLKTATANGPAICGVAVDLLSSLALDRGVRLLGVSASGLAEGHDEVQLSLDGDGWS